MGVLIKGVVRGERRKEKREEILKSVYITEKYINTNVYK